MEPPTKREERIALIQAISVMAFILFCLFVLPYV